LAAALTWPEAVCILDRVREDLCHYCNMPIGASLREMQAVVMQSTAWADHPIMSIMALFCSKITGSQTGFLVVQLCQDDCETHVSTVSPPTQEGDDEREIENACVLLLTREEHYLLLAETMSHRMVFSVGLQSWKGSAEFPTIVDSDDRAHESFFEEWGEGDEDEAMGFVAL